MKKISQNMYKVDLAEYLLFILQKLENIDKKLSIKSENKKVLFKNNKTISKSI